MTIISHPHIAISLRLYDAKGYQPLANKEQLMSDSKLLSKTSPFIQTFSHFFLLTYARGALAVAKRSR